jgi:hypothetical protein
MQESETDIIQDLDPSEEDQMFAILDDSEHGNRSDTQRSPPRLNESAIHPPLGEQLSIELHSLSPDSNISLQQESPPQSSVNHDSPDNPERLISDTLNSRANQLLAILQSNDPLPIGYQLE